MELDDQELESEEELLAMLRRVTQQVALPPSRFSSGKAVSTSRLDFRSSRHGFPCAVLVQGSLLSSMGLPVVSPYPLLLIFCNACLRFVPAV